MTLKRIWKLFPVILILVAAMCLTVACGDSETEGTDSISETESVTESTVDESDTKPDDSESESDSDTEVSGKITYTVKVLDYNGEGYTGAAIATFKKAGMSDVFMTIRNGIGTLELDSDTYTVILTVPGNFYLEASYTLTPDDPTLDVVLSKTSTQTQTIQINYVDYEAVLIEEGATHVSLEGGRTASSFVGERTYFIFTPKRDGIYKFSIIADDETTVGYYGNPLNIYDDTLIDVVDGVFEIPIHSTSIGGAQFTIGITTSTLDNCIIIVERDRDMPITSADIPWTDVLPDRILDNCILSYDNREAVVNSLDLMSADLKVVLNENDGFYHLGTADGPVVYLRIKSATDIFGINSETNEPNFASFFDISELSRIGIYYYDEDGVCTFKENFNSLISAYAEVCDPDTGVYPLDESLADFVKRYGEYTGWWNYELESNLFDFNEVERPPVENAWLFAACTVTFKDKGAEESSPISVTKAEGATLILNANTHYYLKISQIKDVILTVSGADHNTKVIYNGQAYTPDANGIITVRLAGDSRANIRFEIVASAGNTTDLVVSCTYEMAPEIETQPDDTESETESVTETESESESESETETTPEIITEDEKGRPVYNFKVVDVSTKQPISDVVITIHMDDEGATVVASGRTDSEGHAAITLDSAEFEYYNVVLSNVPEKYTVENYVIYPEYTAFYYYDMPISLMDPLDFVMDGRDENHGVVIYNGDSIEVAVGESLWFSAPRTAGYTLTINNVPDGVMIMYGGEVITPTDGVIKIKFPTQKDESGAPLDANYSIPNVFQVVNNSKSDLSVKITVG